MVASTVIRELSRCLQGRLEQGLRSAGDALGGDALGNDALGNDALGNDASGSDASGDENRRRISVYLVHPRDLEGVSELPVASLYLWDVAPESRFRSRGSIVESPADRAGHGDSLRRAPAWVYCRYALAIRGRRLEDEHVLVAAGLRELHDRPSVSARELPSLLGDSTVDARLRFPITVGSRPDLWRTLGLDRHRLLIAIEVPAPIPSARREPAPRVFERELDIVDTPAGMSAPPQGGES